MFNFFPKKKKNFLLPNCIGLNKRKLINNNTILFLQNFISINTNTFVCSDILRKGSFLKFFSVRFSISYYRTLLFFLNEMIYDRRYIYSILKLRQKGISMRRTKRYVFHHFYSHFIIYSVSEFQEKYNITTKQNTLKLLLLANHFNTIWYLFWNEDWVSAKEKREKIPKRGPKKHQKWSFNLKYIEKKKPISYIPKKLKKNKKKPIVLKNHFNVGFSNDYIGNNYRNLLTKRGVL